MKVQLSEDFKILLRLSTSLLTLNFSINLGYFIFEKIITFHFDKISDFELYYLIYLLVTIIIIIIIIVLIYYWMVFN